jgi:RimJ/RimL family protein N-acetyltransferase
MTDIALETAPAPRPQRQTLQGRLVTLVPFDPATQAEALYQATHGREQEDQWRWMGDGPYPSLSAYQQAFARKAESSDPLFFAILDNVSGKPVGQAALMRIEPVHRVIEVGNIIFSPLLQRRPGATEAMYVMAKHVFEDLGYRRYEWKCNALNTPSRQAALRLGFIFEGIFRQHMIIKGRNRDTAWFSMLDSEWPRRKVNFEGWLAPENFGPDGQQRTSLSELNHQE